MPKINLKKRTPKRKLPRKFEFKLNLSPKNLIRWLLVSLIALSFFFSLFGLKDFGKIIFEWFYLIKSLQSIDLDFS